MSVLPGSHHERVHKPERFHSSIKFSGVQTQHVKHAGEHNSCSSLVGVVGAGMGAECWDNDCWKRFFVKGTQNLDLKGRTMWRNQKEERKTERETSKCRH